MKKIILSLFFLSITAFGFDYNEILLKTQATIYPKIILLDKNLNNKLVNGKIIYTIIYDHEDYQTALNIKAFIDKTYNGFFDTYPYEIKLIHCVDLSTQTDTTAIYVLNTCVDVKYLADIAKEKGIISFAYDINNLGKGLLFSLNIERSTVFYLNKEKASSSNVDFVTPLLQMVKFVTKENS